MATYTIAAGKIAAHAKSLGANTEDVVSFSGTSHTGSYRTADILIHSGTAPVYFTTDGSAATVAGDNCYVVLPANSAQVSFTLAGSGAVHLISAAAAVYSVSEA